jgi:uncharacterized membrane protein (GlpM family)
MHSSADWIHVLASFAAGGAWIAVVTLAADRLGSAWGGFLSGLPSTVLVAFLFIGLAQGPEAVVRATDVFLLAYAVTGLFLVVFAVFSRRRFWPGLGGALTVWFTLSALISLLKPDNFALAGAIYAAVFLAGWAALTKGIRLPVSGHSPFRYSPGQVAGRALFGGLMIALAVLASKAGGPLYGGIFAGFPAVFVSTLIIVHRSRGLSFARAMSAPMLVTGMITIGVFGTAVRFFVPACGVAGGTVLAFLAAMVSALVPYVIFMKKHRPRAADRRPWRGPAPLC